MAFKSFDTASWRIRSSRVLINGGPNTGKTRSFGTWPHTKEAFLHVLSFPGEKGMASIPQDEYVKAFVWEQDADKKVSSGSIVKEVKDLTWEILSGKHGPCGVFAGDGLHKFMDYVLDDITGGAYLTGVEFEPRLYKAAYNVFLEYLSKVCQTPVPYVVFTSWDGREAERPKQPGERASDIPSHLYPDLPGKLAKLIMGEFPVVVNSQAKQGVENGKPVMRFAWQLVQDNNVKGCGIKGPSEITSKLPKFCPQDWKVLEGLLLGGKDE